jgi:hypothetical protein
MRSRDSLKVESKSQTPITSQDTTLPITEIYTKNERVLLEKFQGP